MSGINPADDLMRLVGRANEMISELGAQIAEASERRDNPVELSISVMVIVILCRSVLDHVATQIRVDLKTPLNSPRTPYFPIFSDQNLFDAEIMRRFPLLATEFPTRYALIRDLQPFANPMPAGYHGENTLKYLSLLANTYKHRALLRIVPFREILGTPENMNLDALKIDDFENYRKHVFYSWYHLEGSVHPNILELLPAFTDLAHNATTVLSYED